MKKIILSAAAILTLGLATAQETTISGFSEGKVFLSGSVTYSSSKTGDFKTDMLMVNPKAGFFVTDNLVLGVHLGYGIGTQYLEDTEGNPVEADITAREAGFFGRYYFTPARRLSFFGELTAAYADAKATPEPGYLENKVTIARAGLAPGINYFVSEHIAFEATYGFLGYNQLNPNGPADNTDSFTVGTSLSNLRFGIVYKL